MSETEPHLLIAFLLQISAMLAIGLTLGQLMRKLHQPAVLGELLGGIVLGPPFSVFFSPIYTTGYSLQMPKSTKHATVSSEFYRTRNVLQIKL